MPLKEDDPRVAYVVTHATCSFGIERTKFMKSFVTEDNMARAFPGVRGPAAARDPARPPRGEGYERGEERRTATDGGGARSRLRASRRAARA